MAKEVFSICETAFRTLEEEIRRRETNWLELSGRRRMRNCEGRRRCVWTFFSREKCLCCTHFGKQRVSLFLSSSRRNGEEGERNLPFVTFDQLFFLFLLPSSSDNKSSFRDDDAGFFSFFVVCETRVCTAQSKTKRGGFGVVRSSLL